MKDPAFLFYPGDYLRDTQCLSESVQVAYDRIMCEHMRNICISKQQLKFFTKRLSEDEIFELMQVLTEVKDGFQIRWVAESIIKRRAYSESRRNNRNSKNKEHMLNTSESYVKHMENENEIVNENINEVEKEKPRVRKSDSFTPNISSLPEWMQKPLNLWVEYKAQKKKKYVQVGWDALVKSIERDFKTESELMQAVERSMANGWSGLFKQEQNLANTGKTPLTEDIGQMDYSKTTF